VVKICGLTRLEDVLLARDLGAWALGFVFAPSPRRLAPAAARGLIADLRNAVAAGSPGVTGGDAAAAALVPALPLVIGVFGDVSAEEIAAVVVEAGFDGVQLHGLAGPRVDEVRAHAGRRARPLVIIKAVPVAADAADTGSLRAATVAAQEDADVVLLDTKSAGRFGGSGTPFPWRLARGTGRGFPELVAGGIGPDNVQAALDESGAWGSTSPAVWRAPPGSRTPSV